MKVVALAYILGMWGLIAWSHLRTEKRFTEKAICRAYRVPPWVAGVGKRPSWPVRAWYWLRAYRP